MTSLYLYLAGSFLLPMLWMGLCLSVLFRWRSMAVIWRSLIWLVLSTFVFYTAYDLTWPPATEASLPGWMFLIVLVVAIIGSVSGTVLALYFRPPNPEEESEPVT